MSKVVKESRYDREYKDYSGWDKADIDLHKSIDWAARGYKEYPVVDDTIEGTVTLYGDDDNYKEKVTLTKVLRPNPTFPPYYKALEKPFKKHKGVVGPMYDGKSHGAYDIHDRYESQGVYDLLSDSFHLDGHGKPVRMVDDVEEDKPFTLPQLVRELYRETRHWTKESDTIWYGFERESKMAVDILEKHYYNVSSEKISRNKFEVTFSEPKHRLVKVKSANGVEVTKDDKSKEGEEGHPIQVGLKGRTTKLESMGRRLVEGPGAGYEIRSSGYDFEGDIVSYKVASTPNTYEFRCRVKFKGTLSDFVASSYGSSTGEVKDLPIECDEVLFDIDKDIAFATGVVDESDHIDEDVLLEVMLQELSGASCSYVYGGGWSHSTYNGRVTEGYLSGTYALIDADIFLTNQEDIDEVDNIVSGYGYETLYGVFDSEHNPYDEFEDEEIAIEYAKDNDLAYVREIYVIQKWYDEDIEFGSIVWENEDNEDEE